MTEVPKGLITSKELGMAVADRLRQAEKRPETPGSEPTPKQQAHRRRMLQPPAREERTDRHAAPAMDHSATQKFLEEYKPGDWKDPEKSIWNSRERTDEFRAKAFSLPPMTDEEWKDFQRIETAPIAELLQKYGIPNNDGKFIPYVPDSPDSKTPERRTFWEAIGARIAGLIGGAVQSRKDKPVDKK
jgi:hypothetical protein